MSRRAHGLRAWMIQRITAVYLAGYALFLGLHFSLAPPEGFLAWRAWASAPLIASTGALFVLAVLAHAWVGVRDVLMDYAKPAWLRFVALTLTGVFLLGCGVWFARILLHS